MTHKNIVLHILKQLEDEFNIFSPQIVNIRLDRSRCTPILPAFQRQKQKARQWEAKLGYPGTLGHKQANRNKCPRSATWIEHLAVQAWTETPHGILRTVISVSISKVNRREDDVL